MGYKDDLPKIDVQDPLSTVDAIPFLQLLLLLIISPLLIIMSLSVEIAYRIGRILWLVATTLVGLLLLLSHPKRK